MATSLTYLQDESRVDSFLRLSAVVKWWNSREYRADKLESSCKRSSALSVWSPPDRNSYVPRRASFLSQFSSFLRRNNVSSDVSIPGYSLNSRNMRIINKTRSDSTKGRPIQKTSKKNTILLYFFFFFASFFPFSKAWIFIHCCNDYRCEAHLPPRYVLSDTISKDNFKFHQMEALRRAAFLTRKEKREGNLMITIWRLFECFRVIMFKETMVELIY